MNVQWVLSGCGTFVFGRNGVIVVWAGFKSMSSGYTSPNPRVSTQCPKDRQVYSTGHTNQYNSVENSTYYTSYQPHDMDKKEKDIQTLYMVVQALMLVVLVAQLAMLILWTFSWFGTIYITPTVSWILIGAHVIVYVLILAIAVMISPWVHLPYFYGKDHEHMVRYAHDRYSRFLASCGLSNLIVFLFLLGMAIGITSVGGSAISSRANYEASLTFTAVPVALFDNAAFKYWAFHILVIAAVLLATKNIIYSCPSWWHMKHHTMQTHQY